MAEPQPLAPDPALTELAEEESDSLVDELRNIATDAQTVIEAELAFHSARMRLVIGGGKGVVLWLGLALAGLMVVLIAVVVGVLLALAPAVGAWTALAIVTGALVVLIVVSLLIARRRINRIRRLAFPVKTSPAA